MFSFSDNHQLRQHYLQEQQVPTQSMMKRKMSSNLAAVFFESMNPKQKVLAGLEPSLKGGGSDWHVPPKELLIKNRAVLKPLDHKKLTKLNYSGIAQLAFQILMNRHNHLKKEKTNMLRDSDIVWQNTIKTICQEKFIKLAQIQKKENTEYIKQVVDSFSVMYRTNLNNIEKIFHEGLVIEMKTMEEETRFKMNKLYDALCKSQASSITNEVTEKVKQENERLKAEFIGNLEICRTEMNNRLHDLNVDKHVAVENLRTLLEYQKLACQMYVCLKEKEECFKDIEESKQKHKKIKKHLTETTALLDLNIRLAEHKESKQQELNSIWQRKVSLVVKNFQMFVSYCLNTLPDHAEFFINMEKLMLLQVNQALQDPNAESIIAVEEEYSNTPVPQPKPFYLFCDRGNKTLSSAAEVKQDLCPKHSGTSSDSSSASKLPVIVINKRCLYAACDNFEQFTNKIEKYTHGNNGDDADIKDDQVYENLVPVKYTSSQQLSEKQLESSLLQILQQEMSNFTKVPFAGCTPHCLCKTDEDAKKITKSSKKSVDQEVPVVSSQLTNTANTFTNISRLEHEREPKLKNYIRYTEPKTCACAKSCKKHLEEHLPAYMRNMSTFDAPELPNYETCPVATLKKLVSQARGQKTLPSAVPTLSKTKDISTQCTDEEYDLLCTCFSHSNIDLLKPVNLHDQCSFEKVSPSYMTATQRSFAVDRAHSLRKLIEDAPELKEIFNKKNT